MENILVYRIILGFSPIFAMIVIHIVISIRHHRATKEYRKYFVYAAGWPALMKTSMVPEQVRRIHRRLTIIWTVAQVSLFGLFLVFGFIAKEISR